MADELGKLIKDSAKEYIEEIQKDGIYNKTNLITEVKTQIEKELAKKIAEDLTKALHANITTPPPANDIEDKAEKWIFRVRWLLVPAFLASGLVLVGLLFAIGIELAHLSHDILKSLSAWDAWQQNQFILHTLGILDLLIVGALIVIVALSGYENSVSPIEGHRGGPKWLGNLNISSLKIKIAAAIVAISSIHLLRAFMSIKIEGATEETMSKIATASPASHAQVDGNFMWLVVIHGALVVSALVLAWIDKISDDRT